MKLTNSCLLSTNAIVPPSPVLNANLPGPMNILAISQTSVSQLDVSELVQYGRIPGVNGEHVSYFQS